METKHTPGPWATNDSATKVIAPMRHVICTDIQARTVAESQANARLIAAAPELLALARDVLKAAEHSKHIAGSHLERSARAAIAKASA